MRLYKTFPLLVVLCCLLLGASPFSDEEWKNAGGLDIAIAMRPPRTMDEENKRYDGVIFPVYLGYFTVTRDNEFFFTRMTTLRVPVLDKLEELEKTGATVIPEFADPKIGESGVLLMTESPSSARVRAGLRKLGIEDIGTFPRGKARVYDYNFTKTMVYHYKPGEQPQEYCQYPLGMLVVRHEKTPE